MNNEERNKIRDCINRLDNPYNPYHLIKLMCTKVRTILIIDEEKRKNK